MKTGSTLTWTAVALGFVGLAVRWYESYLIGTDVGHIPVSNLYEVFVLFCLITAMLYLYYEARYQTRQMGAFVLLVISARWASFSGTPLTAARTKSSRWCRRSNPGG